MNPPDIEAAHTDLSINVNPPTTEEIRMAGHQTNQERENQQAGFRKDRSCTDRIATLRIIVGQSIEWNSSLYINFIVYEKAFDSVDRRRLWKILRHYGVPEKIVNIIRNSKDGLQCKVVCGGQLTDAFQNVILDKNEEEVFYLPSNISQQLTQTIKNSQGEFISIIFEYFILKH
ncbi:unnamed protein product [Schistosoma mattheei]|uniref:Uncharacterized protein n=1 Tax=Schistosoma mattheei TaxID=31246 RepID=A0A183PTJ3_9TREM|nr:unnamed protein product [Schistosoma mattheei]